MWLASVNKGKRSKDFDLLRYATVRILPDFLEMFLTGCLESTHKVAVPMEGISGIARIRSQTPAPSGLNKKKLIRPKIHRKNAILETDWRMRVEEGVVGKHAKTQIAIKRSHFFPKRGPVDKGFQLAGKTPSLS